MFPNAGLECVVDGVMHPLHGELWSAPAHVIERSDTDLVMRWTTRQLLRLERRISLPGAKPVIFVEERIENDTEHQVAYAWGHHPAFAAAPGTRIDLPPGPVHIDENAHDPEVDLLPGAAGRWPWVAGRTGGNAALDRIPEPPVERVCYLPDRRAGWAALRDLQSGRGVGVAWDVDAYPHLWLWENFGVARFPFHGRARLVTLEPVSCWPSDGLAKAIERGRARWLGPRSGASSWVTVSLFAASRQSAVAVERDGQVRLANELSPRSVLET
jgi:galactose mutarotase-like enzyme